MLVQNKNVGTKKQSTVQQKERQHQAIKYFGKQNFIATDMITNITCKYRLIPVQQHIVQYIPQKMMSLKWYISSIFLNLCHVYVALRYLHSQVKLKILIYCTQPLFIIFWSYLPNYQHKLSQSEQYHYKTTSSCALKMNDFFYC